MKRRRILDDEPALQGQSHNMGRSQTQITFQPEKKIKVERPEKISVECLQQEIRRRRPTLNRIMTVPMSLDDRIELYQMFVALGDHDQDESEDTQDFELSETIRKRLDEFERKGRENKKRTGEEEKVLLSLEKEHEEEKDWKSVVLSLKCSDRNRKVIYSGYKRLEGLGIMDEEYSKLKSWLDIAVSLPFDRISENKTGISELLRKTRKSLDESYWGMEKVKEQVLLYLTTRMNGIKTGVNLCLIGPPGCGKTSIVRGISTGLEIPFYHISLGGLKSSEFIKGHDFTYVGSGPGEIVRALIQNGVKNGIVFFDECDKTSPEVLSTLLHIIDSSQNTEYRDTYLSSLSLDLSSVFFMFSMNTPCLDKAFMDRLYMVELSGFTVGEKIEMVKSHLFPKILSMYGFSEGEIVFFSLQSSSRREEALEYLMIGDNEPGVRGIENRLKTLVEKLYFIKTTGNPSLYNMDFGLKKGWKPPVVLTKEVLLGLRM